MTSDPSQAVSLSEQKWREIAARLPDYVAMVTPEGTIVYLNRADHGMTVDEVVGMNAITMTPPEYRPAMQAAFAHALQTGEPANYEVRYDSPSGEPRYFDIRVSPLAQTGQIDHLLLSTHDITRLKQLEQDNSRRTQRLINEAHLQALFEYSPISIWEEDFSAVKARFDELRATGVTDWRGHFERHPEELFECAGRVRILNINQASIKFFEAKCKEDIPKNLPQYFTAESLRVFQEELIALAEGHLFFESEIPIVPPSGKPKELFLSLSVVPGYADTLQQVIISFVDITERKQAESAMRRAKEEAERASQTKSEFLSRMSHELRTPLNAILGFSALMQKDADIPASQQQNLAIINRSGEHLLGLINDVLDMAKVDAGRIVLEEQAFDLGHLVRDVTDMMSVRAYDKHLQLTIDQDSRFPRFIVGDEARLRQTLINLIGNAIKFTREGGVSVRLSTRENHAAHLIIEVEDSGIGITPENQSLIFEPFVQVGDQGEQRGTGLGLAISRQFVHLMGGDISVESTPGMGTIFRVDLPMREASAVDVLTSKEHSYSDVLRLAPDQSPCRVLIVEDQLENQLLLGQLMETIGCEVKIAHNGLEGVQLFESWKPDLIWMDRRMPVMDGVEAAVAIRRLAGGDRVKVVAVTASAFIEQRDEMLAAGMDDFIRKPYRAAEIYECMSRLLGVRFEHQAKDVGDHARGEVTVEMLENIPQALRGELKGALRSLEAQRIADVLSRIAPLDPSLHARLAVLVDDFNYPAILKVLS